MAKIKTIIICVMLVMLGLGASASVRVGLAWQPNPAAYDRVVRSVELAGGEAVILPQVCPAGMDCDNGVLAGKYVDNYGVLLPEWAERVKRDTYHGSGIDTVMRDIDAVVFLGGGDISSTLFATPQPWHGLEGDNCNATRDLSEYLTMAYCLDHDVPVLGICRGMQMLAVVSGAQLIQDLPTYYSGLGVEYSGVHRDVDRKHYMAHDVTVTDHTSLLYSITVTDEIHNVPSWHHQVVGDVSGTPLRVTGVTVTDGERIIEAVERTDRGFALGVQFHPEEAVRQQLASEGDSCPFMSLSEGLDFFRELVNYCNNLTPNRPNDRFGPKN